MTALRSPGADAQPTEVWRAGATELAHLIRSRAVSSREVIDAHLRRIEAVDARLNAVPVVLAESAGAAADAADRAMSRGDALGPLHGVPFTVKANIDVDGIPTTLGLRALQHAVAPRDAPTVERLRAAGAIPLGHTNCPTLAVRWHTDSELWGATVNPWDPALTPGASSGGEAVALATGMSPIGVGSDGLGSLRWPGQCCGVATLKPSLGRIPAASSVDPVDPPIGVQLTAVIGPLARRVEDLRLALSVLAGRTWRDPWSVPTPLRGPGPRRPIHVALAAEPGGAEAAPDVADGLRMAARALGDAGYAIEEAEPPSVELAAQTLLDMLSTPDVRALERATWDILPPDTRTFLTAFSQVAGDPERASVLRCLATRTALQRAWGEFQEERPLILAPISTAMPFPVGSDLELGRVAAFMRGMAVTFAVNALGLPSVAVPVGTARGSPLAVQIIGQPFREDLCLDAAAAIEDRLGILTPIDPRAHGVVAGGVE